MSETVHLPEELARRLEEAAAARGVSPDELAAEVLREHVQARRRVGFVGIGDSGEGGGDIARRHREAISEAYSNRTAAEV